jgi:cation transport ATPase
LFTLLGPGRQLIQDGVKSLFKGAPNMNTLVGLGALSSFAVSSFAALVPKLVSHIPYSYTVLVSFGIQWLSLFF